MWKSSALPFHQAETQPAVQPSSKNALYPISISPDSNRPHLDEMEGSSALPSDQPGAQPTGPNCKNALNLQFVTYPLEVIIKKQIKLFYLHSVNLHSLQE